MLEPRSVAYSYTEYTKLIMNQHINGVGRLFGGQLLMWLDEVAGITSRRHCGMVATTVAIDNTHFKAGAYLGDIVVMCGKVTYVGKTSLEVRVDSYVEKNDGKRYPINHAYFVMVPVSEDGKPIQVPELILENDTDRMEWENGKRRYELRKLRRKEGF